MIGRPKISIITVVLNSVEHIEKTIQSIFNQTFNDLEYIVIDGASTDGTKEILDKYRNNFSFFVSKKDNGIYEAMNKGMRVAKGEYLMFINSGDELYKANTLEKIFAKHTNADLLYGETLVIDKYGKKLGKRNNIPKNLNFNSFRLGTTVSHQAVIAKQSICPPYSVKYKISSDIDWMLTILKQKPKTIPYYFYFCKYLHGGINKKEHNLTLRERFQIMTKHYGLIPTTVQHLAIVIRTIYDSIRGKKNLN